MNHLIESTTHLELIKEQLKTEFIGLDNIIDQFIDAVTPWCTMKETQTRPLTVNLWGMTGVGKTTLVKRFLELWNDGERVINFNMGSKTYFTDMMRSMEEMSGISGQPCVIIFDEFQHAKTMEGGFKEVENPTDRMIWQLMDDGKFLYTNYFVDSSDLQELVFNLELCLKKGVKVRKGKVIQGWNFFEEIFSVKQNQSERFFLTERAINLIYDANKAQFKFRAMLRDFLNQLDGEQILDYVKKVESKNTVDRCLDFSKALIFVIGNLDEAYFMSGGVSAEDDPDYFHEQSKKITFSTIKEALKERFRMEEIARLGNIHLIYPAFSSQFFKNFIEKELKQISKRFKKAFGCTLEFTEEVADMLFEEGVTASQGFRPLRSSIQFLVESTVSNLFQKAVIDQAKEVVVSMDEDDLVIYQFGMEVARKQVHLPVRKAKRMKLGSQTMAVTAVHEAGHAIVYGALFGRLPKKVTITSSDHATGGYVEMESTSDFDNYEIVSREVAVKMGGKKAEELVFGKDHQSTFGCSHDVYSATKSLIKVIRGGVLPDFNWALENPIHGYGDLIPESEKEMAWVKKELDKGSRMAAQILEAHQDIFKKLIQILLKKRTLTQEGLGEVLIEEGVAIHQLLNSYPPLPDYKARLEDFLNKD